MQSPVVHPKVLLLRYQLLEYTLTRSLGGTISLRPESLHHSNLSAPGEGCSWGSLRPGRNLSLHGWVQARSGAKSLHMVGSSSTWVRHDSEIPHKGKGWRTGLGSSRNPGGCLLQPSRRESAVSNRGCAELSFILRTDVRIDH